MDVPVLVRRLDEAEDDCFHHSTTRWVLVAAVGAVVTKDVAFSDAAPARVVVLHASKLLVEVPIVQFQRGRLWL